MTTPRTRPRTVPWRPLTRRAFVAALGAAAATLAIDDRARGLRLAPDCDEQRARSWNGTRWIGHC